MAATQVRTETAVGKQSTNARTLGELVLRAGEQHASAALRHRVNGRWREISYRDLGRAARDVGRGLIALGLERGDRVSVLANTRAEWTLVDMGAFCAGGIVAPIYHTNAPEECQYILAHSDARIVFVEDDEQLQKIERMRADCPALEHVIVFEGEGRGAITLDELMARGADVPDDAIDERVAATSPDDVATLIYTSGTTGPPKGCILTHDNFLAASRGYQERLDLLSRDVPIVFFMFLPLAHSLARVIQVCVLDIGGTLAFWDRRPERLLDDIREVRPTYLPSIPRVFEKIYTAAHSGVAEQSRAKQAIFNWAVATGRRVRAAERSGRRLRPDLALRHRVADRLVLRKVRDLFGGRIELAASGAAPIAKEVLEFFDACGVLIVEGWGMSETAAAGAINTVEELRFGTVGKPLPGTELRVAEDGELLMRGPLVFRGYFKDEEATRKTLVDGWLATGDLATIDDDGFVSIVGRKKDLIITSSGKNISPSNIENLLKQSRWISHALVVGDNRPYLVALLTLDPDEVPKLAAKLGVDPDPSSMANDPRVRATLQDVVDEVNSHLARIEQIKRFAILDHDLTQAAKELTPTLKVRRNILEREYADVIDALYAQPKGS